MDLEPARFSRLILLCTDCEKRDNGPRSLAAKPAMRQLKHLVADGPGKVKLLRTRCMGLCPRKAMAAVVCGEGLAPATAELAKDGDLEALARSAAAGTAR
ncbi:Uncharacterised protein [Xylophilus ampelinus]|nr:hypothetical protein [Variovorax sp.]VTY36738.1 Uncharacterised protein [Xylophilus ampelinus]